MLGNRSGREPARMEDEPAVLGLFRSADDAWRALHALRENHYTPAEMAAAFRASANLPADVDRTSAPVRGSGQWFGQLREIYRGADGARTDAAHVEPVEPEVSTTGFDAMLAQLNLSPQDALTVSRDFAAIVRVRAAARATEARALLEKWGALILPGSRNIVSTLAAEPKAETPEAPTIVHSSAFHPPPEPQPDHIQLFGEELRVRKEKVSTGDVRVRKESITRMETIQVPVTREHLVVEHGIGGSDEDAIRIPLSEERVHVDKDTILREEYKVGKREITQNQSVSDTVRRERLLIDDAGAKTND